MIIDITSQDHLEEELKDSNVILDFWASWCGPCKMLMQQLDSVSDALTPHVKILKVGIEDLPEIASTYQVKALPRLIFLQDGEPKESSVGYKSAQAIIGLAQTHLLK